MSINDDKIDSLTPYQHSRLRVGMWFGSENPITEKILGHDNGLILSDVTYVPALWTSFREIIDNSFDEISKGFGNKISIHYNENTMEFSIEDNGRGIPFDSIETVFTKPYSGRNFRERGDQAGQNGVGATITNFTSKIFKVTVQRDNKIYYQEFHENQDKLNTDFGPEEIIIHSPKIKNKSSIHTGTKIQFIPSDAVFKHKVLPESYVKSRMIDYAICNPNIKIYYNDELIKTNTKIEKSLFKEKPITLEVNLPDEKFSSVFYLQPNFHSDNDEAVHSLVNNIPIWDKNGKHLSSFRSVFYNGLLDALKSESKKRKLNPNKTDIAAGLLIYNITRIQAPTFDSQNKQRLTNVEAERYIKKYLEGDIQYKKIIREYPEWIDEIYKRCAFRTHKQDSLEVSKIAKNLKKSKVEKLLDATGKDRSKCILLLAEGDSSIGIFSNIRNPQIHGGLPLKGKPLNAYKVQNPKEILQNEELLSICNSLGLIPGQKANKDEMRYNQIWFACDMDEDGNHITGLLTAFFYKWWPELFDPNDPTLFSFSTPFIIARKNKESKYWYAHNYSDFDANKYKSWDITRAKGLGTLKATDWDYSLKNPVLIPIVSDEKLQETLDLIFNESRANDRKKWLEKKE